MTDKFYPTEQWFPADQVPRGRDIYGFAPQTRIAELESIISTKFRQVDSAIRFLMVALVVCVAVMVGAVVWLAAQIPT